VVHSLCKVFAVFLTASIRLKKTIVVIARRARLTHDMSDQLIVRDAADSDVSAIQCIYAHHVVHSLATFEEVPPTSKEMSARRASIISAGLPYLVATQGGEVVGYCYAGKFHSRAAYRYTIENSIYVSSAFHGRGIGKVLLGTLINRCEAGPWRQMIALIGDSSPVSIRLHQGHGFHMVGTLKSVGFKFGRWVDVAFMQRGLGPGSTSNPIDARGS
jgi:L-amino acid N-acyltransferase YncA